MKEGAYYVDGYSINKTEFGERIKSAREELKMTQTQLAQLLKTSQTTVAKYEHGEQIPRADVLAAIAKQPGKAQIGYYLEIFQTLKNAMFRRNNGSNI